MVDGLRERITEALRYWEPMRLLYNAVLGAEVVAYYFVLLPTSKTSVTRETVLFVFVLAVAANIAYCAAYPVDLFVQASLLRDRWRMFRNVLFLLGMALAAVFTRWFSIALMTAGT